MYCLKDLDSTVYIFSWQIHNVFMELYASFLFLNDTFTNHCAKINFQEQGVNNISSYNSYKLVCNDQFLKAMVAHIFFPNNYNMLLKPD